jgi:hypothetical protein
LRCSTYPTSRVLEVEVSSCGLPSASDALVDQADLRAGVEVGQLAQAVLEALVDGTSVSGKISGRA